MMPTERPQPGRESLQPEIKLTVISGPDAGLSLSFVQREISIGRAPENDFVLSDGFVSGEHGEIVARSLEDVEYRDLASRHGSLVAGDESTDRLHDEGEQADDITDDCELQVGCTLIKVEIGRAEADTEEFDGDTLEGAEVVPEEGPGPEPDAGDSDKVITQALEPVQSISRRFQSDDERLAILFRLAGELNGRTELDEILDLVVDATFDAFENANFFAITLVSNPEEVGEESPFYTRVRGDLPDYQNEDEEPIISTSILEHVVDREESVLFLKDSIGSEVTESILEAEITSCLCAPLVGQRSLLGVMEVDTRGRGGVFSRRDLDLFSVLASNVAFALERAELSSNIVEMFESFVAASVEAIEARDPTTAGHSHRVTEYTVRFAETVNEIDTGAVADLELDRDELRELRYAALLHDFGKIAVAESVLQKGKRLEERHLERIRYRFETIESKCFESRVRERVGGVGELDEGNLKTIDARQQQFRSKLETLYGRICRLANTQALSEEDLEWVEHLGSASFEAADGTEYPFLTPFEEQSLSIRFGTLNDDEWEEIKSHPAHSERFLERIPWSNDLRRIPTIAGAHHEKLDGSGYPKGLDAEDLIPQVRMLTIADIFDALTASDRPYRDAYSIEKAVEILRAESDSGKLDSDLVDVFIDRVLPEIRDLVPRTEPG